MVCTSCGLVGADVRPDWRQQAEAKIAANAALTLRYQRHQQTKRASSRFTQVVSVELIALPSGHAVFSYLGRIPQSVFGEEGHVKGFNRT
jgi:hypothetical protein